ncbi:MAG: DUF294 nucleotidyltransferase-like domain-containing protein [Bacteroidota bacterium]|nr:DUF294 nucleotidyltransferase-like domain-containing protein [Bacteroidota bacterium]
MPNIIQYLTTKKFLIKILFPTFLTIALFIVSIFQIIIPRFEETILDRKREMIRELTNSAWSVIERQYEIEQQGSITLEEAQTSATEQIRYIRYGSERKDYFWITDMQPEMIMHPYRSDLEGTNLSDFKDSHNKKLFLEIVKVVKEKREGYVDYMWQWKDDSTRIVPKLSYVKEFNPWGWIIGTGIYIEDVKLEIASLEKNLINISIAIMVTISLLLMFITIQNIKIEKRRRQTEDELKESREKYRTLVEASTEGLIMILEGKKVFYNKTLHSMLGYSDEEFVNLNLDEIFTGKFSYGDTIKFSQIETHLRKRDGSLLDVLLTISSISFLGKEGTIIIVKDISKHKEIEEALGESREKYIALTNQLTIGVFRAEVNKEIKFIELNPAVALILGCKNYEELLGLSLIDFFEDSEEGKTFLKELIDVGSIKNKVVQIRRRDSVLAILSVSVVVLRIENGRGAYCDGIIEDITENKRTEEDRESLISELQTSLLFLNQPIEPFVKECLSCDMNLPVSKVGKLMTKNDSDSILIKTVTGEFIGIVTNHDLTDRVLGVNLDFETPVFEIMSSPLISVQITSSIFEAILLFYDKNIDHLVVTDENGKVCGTVSVDDIQKAHHLTYLFFIQNIQKAGSVEEISRCYSKLLILIKVLIDSEANVRNTTRMITIIADTITKKIISLAIEELGVPPVQFVFMSLGSEGREEQTLVTDQDNAIIYEDVSGEREIEVREYFLKLSERVCTSLNSVGYTYCKGNVMAKNPKWCQPLSVWKKYFSDWVTTANPQDLLDINIFFDFRPVYGNESFVVELRNHLHNIISGNNPFFVYLTQNALKIKPPIGLLKSSEVFDIKLALLPIVDLIRIYSLKNKIKSTNTIERLNQLHEKNIFSKPGYQDLLQAYNFLMQIRFKHQAKLLSEGLSLDNNVNPKHLSDLEQTILRKILTQVANLQSTLSLN